VPDSQIASSAVRDGKSDYLVPDAAQFTLKAVNALFSDNGAAGDWLPAVVLISDDGQIIARAADQAVKVVGGDDAEVSWFPGVKNSGAGFQGLPWAFAHDPIPSSGYPSGAVITPVWGATGLSGGTPNQNSGFHFTPSGAGQALNVSADGFYSGVVVLSWPASFAGNRYVEIDAPQCDPMPQRFEQSGTPEGDVLVLPVAFVHGRAADDQVSVNVFQASGANQTPTDVWVQLVYGGDGP
jgi:hypothetical protein